MGNAPKIFNYADSTVTWGEDTLDVSREVYTANPLLKALRSTAVQYDKVTEGIIREAGRVADDARLIQEAAKKGHYLPTPSHQASADLARLIAKREALVDTLASLVWAAGQLEEQAPEPTYPEELTGRQFEVTPTKGVNKGEFVTVYGEDLGNHLQTLGMPAEEVQKKLVTVSWLSQGQAVMASEAGMAVPVLIKRTR